MYMNIITSEGGADDIWNTPVKRAGGDTAFVKESSSDKEIGRAHV